MSDEGRRQVSMDTILALVAGKGGEDVTGLMSFLTGKDLDDFDTSAVAALVKGWLYKAVPKLMDSKLDESTTYDAWLKSEAKRLGADNVSITPIPEADMTDIGGVLDKLAADKALAAEQAAKIGELEAAVAGLDPFKAKAEELEKKIAGLESKIEGLEGEKTELTQKVAEFSGKLPVAESEINDTIKDIVTKALKDAVASVPLGAAAGGEAAAAGGEATEAAASDSGGGVPDSFGFGSSGDDSDGFGF